MKLTIGMAVHNDYSGVFMTVNALRHYQDLTDTEILVVDNAPGTRQSYEIKMLLNAIHEAPTRYVEYGDVQGAANAKNAVVENALGDYVLVIDCHVLLVPNDAIARLKAFYDLVPQTQNLYQGPMITHGTRNYAKATHLYPQWGDGMYGQWATAWITADGQFVQTRNNEDRLAVSDLLTNVPIVAPEIEWAGHEPKLQQLGWRLAIDNKEPFEIPAQGSGLFSCRRDAWLGFHKDFKEFGGEEYYIQDKYRYNNRATYCLPWLQWHHRFYRDVDPTYPNRKETKFANAVLWHKEFNKDTTEVVEHFTSIGLSPKTITKLLDNPLSIAAIPYVKPACTQPTSKITRKQLFEQANGGSFAYLLKNLASKFKHVTELTNNNKTPIYLLSGNPKTLVSYVEATDANLDLQMQLLPTETYHQEPITWTKTECDIYNVASIQPTEMLFLNLGNDDNLIGDLLQRYAKDVSHCIVVPESPAVDVFVEAQQEAWIANEPVEGYAVLKRPIDDTNRCGVGTELARILSWMNIHPVKDCACKDKARKMDKLGIKWCLSNRKLIIDWLEEEHKNQKMRIPFSRFGAGCLIYLAALMARLKGCTKWTT
jgi:glycosyltransferase involved in cell wall biosynthesis